MFLHVSEKYAVRAEHVAKSIKNSSSQVEEDDSQELNLDEDDEPIDLDELSCKYLYSCGI